MRIADHISRLRKDTARQAIEKRLADFDSFRDKNAEEWFSEMCYCLLTANSKARIAMCIQHELGPEGFCSSPEHKVRACIMKHKHRFHNNKARFIVGARDHLDIKRKITAIALSGGEHAAREWLVKNIKGLGYKEASHFLRNVGYRNLAILDRHILNIMLDEGLISEKPKALTKKKYLEIEKIFNSLAERSGMSPAELDIYLWYTKAGEKTGEVLK